MPVAEDVKSSWADEVELEGGALPPPTEVRENGFKIMTEYKYNDDDKKVKIVRTYKIKKCVVSKSIALRKTWPKFGECANDKPGPNPATTIVGEDVYMQYITSKEEDNKPEDEGIDKLKGNSLIANALKLFPNNTCYSDGRQKHREVQDLQWRPLDLQVSLEGHSISRWPRFGGKEDCCQHYRLFESGRKQICAAQFERRCQQEI